MLSPLLSLLITFTLLAILAAIFWPDTGLYARWQRSRRMTTRVLIEDALKHILSCDLENRHPTIQSIAGALSVTQNKAADLTAQLEARRLLRMDGGEFKLTLAGREYALRVIRAHRLWEQYLSERTGYAELDWHGLAEMQEHSLSPEEVDELARGLGNPSHDPHGDPIPTSSGDLRVPEWLPLTNLPPDRNAQIVHIEDEPPVIYSQIVAEGLHTGMLVTVLEATPERVRFWTNGDEHILAPLMAKNISVAVVEHGPPTAQPGVPLTDLRVGESARVLTLSPAIRGAERRRLMDLGLLPGTEVTAELKSPSGDPTAYIIRGALIALRAEQAQHIKITSH